MNRADRLLQVGSVVAGLGGTLTIAYLIYALEFGVDYWASWPSWVGVGALTVGGVLLIAALVARSRGRESEAARQALTAGDMSTNYQAGGDIHVKED